MVPVPSIFTPGVLDWTRSNSSPMNLSIIYFADAWKLADNILEPALPTTNDDNKNKNQPPPAPPTTTKTNNTLSEIKILHPSCIHFFNLSKARGPPRAALRPREDGANRPLNGRERVQGPPFKGAFLKRIFRLSLLVRYGFAPWSVTYHISKKCHFSKNISHFLKIYHHNISPKMKIYHPQEEMESVFCWTIHFQVL